MEKKEYIYELNFIRRIRNWRRSHDESGLTQLQRCHQTLEFILDELMPRHKTEYNLSLLEVNRYYHIIIVKDGSP